MPDSNVEVLTITNKAIEDAKNGLNSLKSVIAILEKIGQIPDGKVDAYAEERPDGSAFYMVTGINGYSRECKSLPEASQALIEAGHHKDSSELYNTKDNKNLVGMSLGSGIITANKDYKFVIDLFATALIGSGLGAILGTVFKIEIKRSSAIGALSATAAKIIIDKGINYE